MKRIILFLLAAALGQALPAGLSAQSKKPSIFEQLSLEEGASLTLATDMNTLIAQKKTAAVFKGTLTTAAGKTYEVQLRPSGKFRRMKAATPPLKIKFKKKDLLADGLDTLNKVKIIMPWFETAQGEDLLVKEYLCYRMFEQLTPHHVRGRLLRLTLKNTSGGGIKKMLAILVEDDAETAARLQGKVVKRYGVPIDSFDARQAAMTALFQYFVGNTDWSFLMVRNVRLIQPPNGQPLLPVPYDFDFAGFVAAPYASPSSESGLKSVRDRFLMADGIREEVMVAAVDDLKRAKDKLYAICSSPHLSEPAVVETKAYMDVFFKKVGKKNKLPAILRE